MCIRIVESESYTARLISQSDHMLQKADSVALRSDCAYMQADLQLHCLLMSKDPFRVTLMKLLLVLQEDYIFTSIALS